MQTVLPRMEGCEDGRCVDVHGAQLAAAGGFVCMQLTAAKWITNRSTKGASRTARHTMTAGGATACNVSLRAMSSH